MKKLLLVFILIFIAGCSGDDSSSDKETSSIKELSVADSSAISSKRIQGTISTKAEVDRYLIKLAETGRILQIRCTSQTLEPDVDLLVNVYEKDGNGNLNMIAGSHAPENSKFGADIKINIFVDKPKDIYVYVRDLKDNDFSNNPYHISAYYESVPDGNGTFESAVKVDVNGSPVTEAIGTVGDVDCFGFNIINNGVYDVVVDYSPVPGTGVRLSLDLYDSKGNLIESRNPGATNTSHMVHYLKAGDYKLVVDDEGKDDFDPSSSYKVSVSQNTNVAEIKVNDTPATASGSGAGDFASGSIDYYEDADWYKVSLIEGADINIMELSFQSDFSTNYRLELFKLKDSALGNFDFMTTSSSYSHIYRGGSETPYTAILKLDDPGAGENYYFCVRPQSGAEVSANRPYKASITMENISDPDEAGNGNDLDSNAIDITGNEDNNRGGKIAYRGDIDWYKIKIPLADKERVLGFFLDIPETKNVEYAMEIKRETRSGEDASLAIDKRVINQSSDHRNLDLKTSFMVKGQDGGAEGYTDAVYYIKVYDFQNDDGENLEYQLKWTLDEILPLNIFPKDSGPVTGAVYNSEENERNTVHGDFAGETVAIDYTDGRDKSFRVNNKALDMSAATSVKDAQGVITITFPWVGGYIDYQDDEDWYSLDLSNPYEATDKDWYYTIEVQLYALNSEVEYTFEYIPDSNHDRKVHGNRCSGTARHCSGIMASSGDTDLAENEFSTTLPSGEDNVLWMGSLDGSYSWKGEVFFRVSDFNYMQIKDGVVNTKPDNDWGYDAPYYFRTILKFHQGSEKP